MKTTAIARSWAKRFALATLVVALAAACSSGGSGSFVPSSGHEGAAGGQHTSGKLPKKIQPSHRTSFVFQQQTLLLDTPNIAVTGGSVWIFDAEAGTLWRFNESNLKKTGKLTLRGSEGLGGITAGDGEVWVDASDKAIYRVDAKTLHVSQEKALEGREIDALSYKAGTLWVLTDTSLLRYDVKKNKVEDTIQLDEVFDGIISADGAVWLFHNSFGSGSSDPGKWAVVNPKDDSLQDQRVATKSQATGATTLLPIGGTVWVEVDSTNGKSHQLCGFVGGSSSHSCSKLSDDASQSGSVEQSLNYLYFIEGTDEVETGVHLVAVRIGEPGKATVVDGLADDTPLELAPEPDGKAMFVLTRDSVLKLPG